MNQGRETRLEFMPLASIVSKGRSRRDVNQTMNDLEEEA